MKYSKGQLIVWAGVALGNLEWLFSIIFTAATDFGENENTKKACVVFILLPPLWYLFIYILYMGSHQEIETGRDRMRKILLSPLYMLAMQFKIYAGIDRFNAWFLKKFQFEELTFNLMTLEKSFRVQVIIELISHTLPMIIIISYYSNSLEWTGTGKFTVFLMALMFIKNLGIVTIFIT